jgi:Major Facilitator Superfamily.
MIGSKQAYFLAITIPFLTSSMVVYSLLYKAVFLSQILNVPASYVEATMSYSFYGGAVGGLALGYIADKFGNRLAMLVSAAIYSAASIAAPFVRSLLILSFLWVIVGFGVNAENGITYAIVVKLFETSRGTFGGFLQGLYFIGMSIDTLLALFLKDVYSYFFIIGLTGAFSAVLFLILPESKSDKRRPSESLKKILQKFCSRITDLFFCFLLHNNSGYICPSFRKRIPCYFLFAYRLYRLHNLWLSIRCV